MLESSTHHPPIVLRSRILHKYYEDLKTMDYVDAYCLYSNAMHILYCKYNPHLKYSSKDSIGYRKLRKPLTRESFVPTTDRFGFPLWIYDLTEEELDSHLTYPEILEQRKLNKRFN